MAYCPKLFSILMILAAVMGWAPRAQAGIQFYKVTSQALLIPLLLPVPEGQTPEVAWARYIRQLQTNADMVELFQGVMTPPVIESFSRVSDKELTETPVVISNDPADFGRSHEDSTKKRLFRHQLRGLAKNFAELGKEQLLLLPLAADLGLTAGNSRDLKRQVANKVSLLVSQGGDDVEPSLYRLPKIWSKYTNKTRDQFEVALIREYVKAEKGFLLGICRGMQITSVALGYQLIQDLPQQMGSRVMHSGTLKHPLNLLPTSMGLFQSVTSRTRILFNSFHHQAVIFKQGGPLEASAIADDGALEAAEFKNKKGFLIQGHPELIGNNLGLRLIRAAVRMAWPNTSAPGLCRSAL